MANRSHDIVWSSCEKTAQIFHSVQRRSVSLHAAGELVSERGCGCMESVQEEEQIGHVGYFNGISV